MSRRRLTLQALTEWERKPFEYGVADCCRFCGHVAKIITGKDHIAAFDYANEDAAKAIINKHGGLGELVTSVLGEPSDELLDGDPILIRLPGMPDPALAVKFGNEAVALGKSRFIRVGERSWAKGWAL